MNDIHLFRPFVSEQAIADVADVLRSGWTGLGPKTDEFEKRFAAYVGANRCVALNSCTSALHLALHVLDLEPGDEVITTPITFVSTNHAILYEGATPVFADVKRGTACIDPASIWQALKRCNNPRAIIAMHYGGQPCDLETIHSMAEQAGVAVIEDCAHAAGASYGGDKVGSLSILNCFSFHSVKNLSIGDGGAVTTSDDELADRMRALRWLGIDKSTYVRTKAGDTESWHYNVSELGYKYHMNDIMAAIGLAQLARLDEDNRYRRKLVDQYRLGLSEVPGVTLLNRMPDRESADHLCAIRVENRRALVRKMKESGVHPGVHYVRNDLYDMYEEHDLPNAEMLQEELLSLPLHLMLTEGDVERVISVISSGW